MKLIIYEKKKKGNNLNRKQKINNNNYINKFLINKDYLKY